MKISMTLEFVVDDASGYDAQGIAAIIAESLSDSEVQETIFEGSGIETKLSDGYFVRANFIEV